MGCQPATTIGTQAGVPCAVHPKAHTRITVGGSITNSDAGTVLLRKLTVGGNITLTGGGGNIPWSIKGNSVGQNVTIRRVTADWLGLQFNTISGTATLKRITVTDPGDQAERSRSWKTRSAKTSTAGDFARACREVSSPAK